MKKYIVLLLVLSMLAIIGCSDGDDDTENGQMTSSPSIEMLTDALLESRFFKRIEYSLPNGR